MPKRPDQSERSFAFGPLIIDAPEYGSQGSAVLGIRDSGKTYTATALAERLFDAGVPFTAFDPIGVWRFLRVPGAGRGYPVVVAGGQAGDLPLSPATAPAIVEAAMQNGISLVLDLFSMELTKADWKRIVRDSVRLLLHRNKAHGLRHIFLEEAAEFIPQVLPRGDSGPGGEVYAEIEKLARMGGNSNLGYTLINQRAEEVNKAVLELCDNLFLHRQKGKNSLNSLRKWLDLADVQEHDGIIRSLPTLPTGDCWAWLAGSDAPVRIQVPAKSSLHPDRRTMRGAIADAKPAVDVADFVATLKGTVQHVEEEAAANDPTRLKRRIAELERELRSQAKATPAPDTAAIERARAEGNTQGWADGYLEGCVAVSDVARAIGERAAAAAKEAAEEVLGVAMDRVRKAEAAGRAPAARPRNDSTPPAPTPAPNASGAPAARAARKEHTTQGPVSTGPAGGPRQRILDAIATWSALGIAEPTRTQTAFLALYSPKSSGFEKQLSAARREGLLDFPASGRLVLTDAGRELARPDVASMDDVRYRVLHLVKPVMRRVLSPLIDAYPDSLSRPDLAARSDYSDRSSGFEKTISMLSGLELVTYPAAGQVRAADWLFGGA